MFAFTSRSLAKNNVPTTHKLNLVLLHALFNLYKQGVEVVPVQAAMLDAWACQAMSYHHHGSFLGMPPTVLTYIIRVAAEEEAVVVEGEGEEGMFALRWFSIAAISILWEHFEMYVSSDQAPLSNSGCPILFLLSFMAS